MDIQHVEYAHKIEALDCLETSDPPSIAASTTTVFDDRGSLSDSPPVVEQTASSANVSLVVPGCVSLPINFTTEKWPSSVTQKKSAGSANETQFCSLREFRLQRKPNRFQQQDYITDEPSETQDTDGHDISNLSNLVPTFRQRSNRNSTTMPIGLIHGFFTLPLNTTFSSMAEPPRYRPPYKNHTFSLFPTVSSDMARIIRARAFSNTSNSQSSENSDKTPDPCIGLQSGPHEPPRPAPLYHSQRKATPAIFQDQFTQFMEDRMVMFRPTSSQNNVEQSLNLSHPYQQVGEVDTIHLRSWFTLNAIKNPVQRASPIIEHTPGGVSVNSPLSVAPANNSTSSFLPRGVQGPCSVEPGNNSTMVYTPRGIPLTDAKRPPLSPITSQCLCSWWPF